MAQYARVKQSVWNSSKFHNLDRSGQLLWLYLLTSPHGNLIGCFVLKPGYALADLGSKWTLAEYDKTLSKIVASGLATYDPECHLILIHNYLEHNPLRGEKQVKAAQNKIDDLPNSKSVLIRLQEILSSFESSPYDTLTIPHRYPNDTPSFSVSVSVAESVSVSSTVSLQLFDKFWKAYPRKVSKGTAEKTWKKLKVNEPLLNEILTGIERAKTSHAWMKDSGKFIPHPSTWLNAKGWEDEYEPYRPKTKSGAKPMQEPSEDTSDWRKLFGKE